MKSAESAIRWSIAAGTPKGHTGNLSHPTPKTELPPGKCVLPLLSCELGCSFLRLSGIDIEILRMN